MPGKNIRPAGGRPLIAWTIEAALCSRYVDRVVLSSDDEEIIAVAMHHGCDVPFRRPAALATDTASSTEVVLDVLHRVEGYDLFVLLQPTSPLRTTRDIDASIELLDASGADRCVSVVEVQAHPWLVYSRNVSGRLRPFCDIPPGTSLRRQDLPGAWALNGALYVAQVPSFLKDPRFVTEETVAYEMPVERSLDIDTAGDFATLESMLNSGDQRPTT